MGLALVYWLRGQQIDAIVDPFRCLDGADKQGRNYRAVTDLRRSDSGVCVFSHPLQPMMQLYGFQQVVLLGPEVAAQALADGSQLAAFGLNGVLGVVGLLDELITLMRQRRGSVQNLLQDSKESTLVQFVTD